LFIEIVAIGKPERQVRKASHWQQATIEIKRCDHSIWVPFFAHIPFVVNCSFKTAPTKKLQQYVEIPLETSQYFEFHESILMQVCLLPL